MDNFQNRRNGFVLVAAALILLIAIAVGRNMGNRVILKATEQGQTGVGSTLTITPNPDATDNNTPFGPNWKRTQILAAAPDPGFPDPRVPPEPLPTPPPTPKPTPPPPEPAKTPVPLQTPVPNPTFTVAPRPTPSGGATSTPAVIPTNSKNLPTPESSPILGPNPPPP